MNSPAQSFKSRGPPARPIHRVAREVAIADHLWRTFDELATSMSTDRESLINQAMFVFARLNGFMEQRAFNPPAAEPRLADSSEDERAHDALAERVLRTADEFQKALEDKRNARADDEEDLPVEDQESEEDAGPSELSGLYLQTDAGRSDRISQDRFVIGRGKQCDLVIDSGKISRQHVVITCEGDDYFIEDQKSANGTFFEGRRLTSRRKIESGDEYLVCNERIRLVIIP